MVAEQPQELSILIVTWNSVRWIDRCLADFPQALRETHPKLLFWRACSLAA